MAIGQNAACSPRDVACSEAELRSGLDMDVNLWDAGCPMIRWNSTHSFESRCSVVKNSKSMLFELLTTMHHEHCVDIVSDVTYNVETKVCLAN